MESSREVQIFDELNINFDNLVNSSLDVFEDCILIINMNNKEKLNEYIKQSLVKEPKIVITSTNCDIEAKNIIKFENYDDIFNHALKKMYPEYISKNFYGLTGTNGKTTTGHYLKQLLGKKALFIGTTESNLFKSVTKEEHLTTPKLFNIFKLLRSKEYSNINDIVLEVSSHALDQNRVGNIKFLVSGFTNLSQDHFDYHKNIENYFKAKKKLFNKKLSMKYVYINNEWGKRINQEVDNKSHSIGFDKENDVSISEIAKKNNKTSITFTIERNEYIVELPFIGPNAELNYLLAFGMAYYSDKLSIKQIISNTQNITNPKGRFEMIPYEENKIFIDYAHTPAAVNEAIQVVSDKYDKVVVIIGAGGNRDIQKRKLMGNAANKADEIIITNDNPRKEDPMFIAKEILSGVDLNKKVEIILDRKKAIKKGLESLRGNSVLLVLGKGHEKVQELESGSVEFNDSEIVKKIIKDMK